ncbi:hypothetical protein ACFX13_038999 [Malus domestica]
MEASPTLSRIGLAGLAVMGQNLTLNIAEKGFPISIYNRTTSKQGRSYRGARRGVRPSPRRKSSLGAMYNPRDFALSIERPRSVINIILVKAEAPVDQTIVALSAYMEPGDAIINGGNE